MCPWSPLASGLLSGKYKRSASGGEGEGRLTATRDSTNPVFKKFTDRNWRIVDALLDVSRALERSPAQVALNWVATRPGVASTIIGATKMEQLEDNLRALDFRIPPELSDRLEEVSRPEPVFPYIFFSPGTQAMITGRTSTRSEPPCFRGR